MYEIYKYQIDEVSQKPTAKIKVAFIPMKREIMEEFMPHMKGCDIYYRDLYVTIQADSWKELEMKIRVDFMSWWIWNIGAIYYAFEMCNGNIHQSSMELLLRYLNWLPIDMSTPIENDHLGWFMSKVEHSIYKMLDTDSQTQSLAAYIKPVITACYHVNSMIFGGQLRRLREKSAA